MAISQLIGSPYALLLIPAALLVFYLYPYLVTYRHLRGIPAPFPAQFSDLWLLSAARRGKRSLVVDGLHQRLGPVVRIQPNHVSIADDEAVVAIYGHGNGFLKSSFYDAFVSIRRGLFNTRDRVEHTRKRKIVSHTFSPRSVAQFEPYIHHNLELFVKQWDGLISTASRQQTGDDDGLTVTAHLDCLRWFNFLAFDIIGDLAFGAPFGMLRRGEDVAEVRSSADPAAPPSFAPAIEILNRRGEVSAVLGCLPQLKPYARWLPDPFFSRGLEAVQNLAGIAVARVRARLEDPAESVGEGQAKRTDLLARLQEGKDEKGEPLGREELTAEALTQLIAGSDTTSNTSCALLFHAARTPGVLSRLQAELDAAVPPGVDVPTFDMVRDLPYLGAVINEALRIHSTSGIGLPRQVPHESPGVTLGGRVYPAGTVLSVPTYTLHHSREIWGPDADEYRPERWIDGDDGEVGSGLSARQKNAFLPFSYGPRACVGRNVAEMEMKLITATWARRYDVFLRQDSMETREGFLNKPLGLQIGIRRRQGRTTG